MLLLDIKAADTNVSSTSTSDSSKNCYLCENAVSIAEKGKETRPFFSVISLALGNMKIRKPSSNFSVILNRFFNRVIVKTRILKSRNSMVNGFIYYD